MFGHKGCHVLISANVCVQSLNCGCCSICRFRLLARLRERRWRSAFTTCHSLPQSSWPWPSASTPSLRSASSSIESHLTLTQSAIIDIFTSLRAAACNWDLFSRNWVELKVADGSVGNGDGRPGDGGRLAARLHRHFRAQGPGRVRARLVRRRLRRKPATLLDDRRGVHARHAARHPSRPRCCRRVGRQRRRGPVRARFRSCSPATRCTSDTHSPSALSCFRLPSSSSLYQCRMPASAHSTEASLTCSPSRCVAPTQGPAHVTPQHSTVLQHFLA